MESIEEMVKNVIIGVLAVTTVVLGLLVANGNQGDVTEAAGTIGVVGRSKTVETVPRFSVNEAVAVKDPKLTFEDLGLLDQARDITLIRTKDTPQRVQLDVDYSYYLSQCTDRQLDYIESRECLDYVRTDKVVKGGSRITLDFSKAMALEADASETVKIRLSTLPDERLHTYSQIESKSGKYVVKGSSNKITFVVRP